MPSNALEKPEFRMNWLVVDFVARRAAGVAEAELRDEFAATKLHPDAQAFEDYFAMIDCCDLTEYAGAT